MVAATASKGTATTIFPDCSATSRLSPPETEADGTASLMRATASIARSRERDPMRTVSPAMHQRTARPKPSGPVPPMMPMDELVAVIGFPVFFFGLADGQVHLLCVRPHHMLLGDGESVDHGLHVVAKRI